MGLSIKEKQGYAWHLYKDGTLQQKAIAEKVGVTEKTISKWKAELNWEEQRKSLLITKASQLTMLYNHLDSLNTEIRDEQEGIPTSGQADSILKLTAAINNLETETSIGQTLETGKEFIQFIQKVDFEKSKEIVDFFDAFLQEKLKTSRG